MITTLFTRVARLEQFLQHPGKQEEIVIKGSFEIQYVVDLHFTIYSCLFPCSYKSLGWFAWWGWHHCVALCMLEGLWSGNCAMGMKITAHFRERRKKKKNFYLNCCLGLSSSWLHTWGKVLTPGNQQCWRMQWGCTVLEGYSQGFVAVEQQDEAIPTEPVLLAYVAHVVFLFSSHIPVLFVFVSLIGAESRDGCAKHKRTGSGIAHISCAEDVSKGFFPALLMLTGLQWLSSPLLPSVSLKLCFVLSSTAKSTLLNQFHFEPFFASAIDVFMSSFCFRHLHNFMYSTSKVN